MLFSWPARREKKGEVYLLAERPGKKSSFPAERPAHFVVEREIKGERRGGCRAGQPPETKKKGDAMTPIKMPKETKKSFRGREVERGRGKGKALPMPSRPVGRADHGSDSQEGGERVFSYSPVGRGKKRKKKSSKRRKPGKEYWKAKRGRDHKSRTSPLWRRGGEGGREGNLALCQKRKKEAQLAPKKRQGKSLIAHSSSRMQEGKREKKKRGKKKGKGEGDAISFLTIITKKERNGRKRRRIGGRDFIYRHQGRRVRGEEGKGSSFYPQTGGEKMRREQLVLLFFWKRGKEGEGEGKKWTPFPSPRAFNEKRRRRVLSATRTPKERGG